MSEQVLYRALSRAVLFRLGGGDPERAHHLTMAALSRVGRIPPARRALARLLDTPAPRRVFGLDFPSPVGLAAGMDKNAVAVQAWPALGFGFVEVGTVTAHAQPGNPQPRLFRLRTSEAIVNRMGFNNDGAAALARTLAAAGPIGVPIGVSLGKSKITPVSEAVEDYLTSLRLVHPYADYLAINVSSPNTPGLRSLQDRAPLDDLLGAMTAEAAALAPSRPDGRAVPVLVKIAPDLTDHAVAEVLEVCQDRGVAGVIATNTTLDRSGISTTELAMGGEAGGLSGRPLRRRALAVVRFVTSHSDLPVIGVGGISDVDAALAMLDAGAGLLQLYTGFIFGGPGLIRDINRAVAARDAREN